MTMTKGMLGLLVALVIGGWQPVVNPPRTPVTDDVPATPVSSAPVSAATVVPTAGVDARPDRCEPNNGPDAACAIALNQNNGPFTFVGDGGDVDFYALDLGTATDGLETTLTVRVNQAEVRLTAFSADGQAVGQVSNPATALVLPATVRGTIRVRVELLTATDPTGIVYTLDAQQTLPTVPTPQAGAATDLTADLLENNWSPALAATIAISTVYDLSFICPDPRPDACSGGDHDYLALPVKAGRTYVLGTFDLGAGSDTVLELFWGREDVPAAINDDAGPLGMASLLIWQAPSDGTLSVRISPRAGGAIARVEAEDAQTYRFAVAMQDTPLAAQIVARVRSQTQPAPTATPTPQPTRIPATGGTSTGGGTGSTSAGTGNIAGSAPIAAAPVAQAPSAAAPTATLVVEPTPGIVVTEDLAPPAITTEPLLTQTTGVRIGYDRNQNKVVDVDEGIRGLVVYVLDSAGIVRGQGMTDASGAVRIAYRARASETLTLNVPYFSWAQPLQPGLTQLNPIVIPGTAALPSVLP